MECTQSCEMRAIPSRWVWWALTLQDSEHPFKTGLPDAYGKLNGHGPYAYLKDVMPRLPTQRASQVGELQPHLWLAHPSAQA
jgi:hypothetical protein